MNTFKKLEAWQKKENYIKMDIDTSYGATCWNVELGNVNKKERVFVSECSFFKLKGEPPFLQVDKDDGWTNHIDYTCFPDMDDWPGLEATILKAIDLAEKVKI